MTKTALTRRLTPLIAIIAAVGGTLLTPPHALAASTDMTAHESCGTFTGDVAWGRANLLTRPYIEVKGRLWSACASQTTLIISYTNGVGGPFGGEIATAGRRGAPIDWQVKDVPFTLENFGNIYLWVCNSYGGGQLCSKHTKATSQPPAPTHPAPPAPSGPVVVAAPVGTTLNQSPHASCSPPGSHVEMNASASFKRLSSATVRWLGVALTGSSGAWFRADLISPAATKLPTWRGLTSANADPFVFNPQPTASVGSKLYVTGFFPDGYYCSVNLLSS